MTLSHLRHIFYIKFQKIGYDVYEMPSLDMVCEIFLMNKDYRILHEESFGKGCSSKEREELEQKVSEFVDLTYSKTIDTKQTEQSD